mmetsp:Transcript_50566/g.50936  ORF Transcript_50566/g.50936 Transcript_50566/m.50936 type:complete len:95 (-) Transcript_50566:334-618(-)
MNTTTLLLLIIALIAQLSSTAALQCRWDPERTAGDCKGITASDCIFNASKGMGNCDIYAARMCFPFISINFNRECFKTCRELHAECCCPPPSTL